MSDIHDDYASLGADDRRELTRLVNLFDDAWPAWVVAQYPEPLLDFPAWLLAPGGAGEEHWGARLGSIAPANRLKLEQLRDAVRASRISPRLLLVEFVHHDLQKQLALRPLAERLTERYLEQYAALALDPQCVAELVTAEYEGQRDGAQPADYPLDLREQYRRRFPQFQETIAQWQPKPPGAWLVGRRVGNFQVEELVGQGGFGLVFRASDKVVDRQVALKFPRSGEPTEILVEGKAAGILRHPNIVSVHEVAHVGDYSFLVTDFVPGPSLARWVAQARLSPREAVELVAEVADAVHYAHRMGVRHRDLKPGNILIEQEQTSLPQPTPDSGGSPAAPPLPRLRPAVADFGLARRRTATETASGAAGEVVAGTPIYASPEQARGGGDERSDVYSVGMILTELLLGNDQFARYTAALRPGASIRGQDRLTLGATVRHWAQEASTAIQAVLSRRGSGIPGDLRAICRRATEADPGMRYPTADAYATDLRHWLRGEPITWLHPDFWRLVLWCRRSPLAASLAAIVLLIAFAALLIGGTVRATLSRQQARTHLSALGSLFPLADAFHRAEDESKRAADLYREQEELTRWLIADLQPRLRRDPALRRDVLEKTRTVLERRAGYSFLLDSEPLDWIVFGRLPAQERADAIPTVAVDLRQCKTFEDQRIAVYAELASLAKETGNADAEYRWKKRAADADAQRRAPKDRSQPFSPVLPLPRFREQMAEEDPISRLGDALITRMQEHSFGFSEGEGIVSRFWSVLTSSFLTDLLLAAALTLLLYLLFAVIRATPLQRPIGGGIHYVAQSPGLRRFLVLVCFVILAQQVARFGIETLLPGSADLLYVAMAVIVLFVIIRMSPLWRSIEAWAVHAVDGVARRRYTVMWCFLMVTVQVMRCDMDKQFRRDAEFHRSVHEEVERARQLRSSPPPGLEP
jgi:serine/threonine protein kinase